MEPQPSSHLEHCLKQTRHLINPLGCTRPFHLHPASGKAQLVTVTPLGSWPRRVALCCRHSWERGGENHLNMSPGSKQRALIGIRCLCRAITLAPGYEHLNCVGPKGLFQTTLNSSSLDSWEGRKKAISFSCDGEEGAMA